MIFDGTATGPLSLGCSDPFYCDCVTPTPTSSSLTPTPTVTPSKSTTPTITPTVSPSETPLSTPTQTSTPENTQGVSTGQTFWFDTNNCNPAVYDERLKTFSTYQEANDLIGKVVTYIDSSGHTSSATIVGFTSNGSTNDPFVQTVHESCDDASDFIDIYNGDIRNLTFRVNPCDPTYTGTTQASSGTSSIT